MSDKITKKDEITTAPAAPAATAPVEERKEEEKKEAVHEEKKKASVPAKFKDIVSKIEEMSVLELHELVKILEEKFGVSATAVASSDSTNAEDGGATEEKTTFTVELTTSGEQKIAVMKVVKEILALGLKDAKDLVDEAPSILKEGVKKGDAEEMKKKIEEAGGKVTLK